MMTANKKTVDEVKDIHRGLHIAMDHLIRGGNKSEAEKVLRQVDAKMTNFLNAVREPK